MNDMLTMNKAIKKTLIVLIAWLLWLRPEAGFTQGKFFGGDGPASYFGSSFFAGTPLPVQLTSLQARQERNGIMIEWKTLSEINNDFFVIERSNGIDFQTLGTVNGAGTITHAMLYSFFDDSPDEGLNYYRLKQVDFDGSFEYSEIISAVFIETNLFIYPNPTDGVFYLNKNLVNASIKLLSVSGRAIDLPQERQFDISSLPNGMYLLKIALDTQTITLPLIKK